MAIFWKSKILLGAIEATYGTDPNPTGAANAILASAVTLSPMEGTDVARNLDLPWFAADPTIPADLHVKLTFSVELAPSGVAGTAPAWGPLLRACGVAETIAVGASVTYNPITDNPESATLYLWIGATLYKIVGCRGSCKLVANASAAPVLQFTFTGLFAQPGEAPRVTPDLSNFKEPLVASAANTPTFTLNAVALKMSAFALDFGNVVTPRFLIGGDEILISGRADMIDATIDAVPITTFNPFDLAANKTLFQASLAHGTTAGAIATLSVPRAQMQRVQGVNNASGITQWPLKIQPQAQAGNDQWTLTLT